MYNTRYWFMKKLYPEYLLLFKTNKNKLGYRCYGIDKYIINYFRNYEISINIILKKLEKNDINYIMIDNLDMIKIYKTNNNRYYKYLYESITLYIFDRIRAGVYR